MNIIAASQIIFSLVPVIVNAVQSAETNFGTGNGSVKLKWVLDTVETIFNQAAESAQQIDPNFPKYASLVNTITAMVSSTVAAYNSVGAFIKGAKAA